MLSADLGLPGREPKFDVLHRGRRSLALDIKAGDTILFSKYAGTEVKLDGTDILVVKEDDIFAILG